MKKLIDLKMKDRFELSQVIIEQNCEIFELSQVIIEQNCEIFELKQQIKKQNKIMNDLTEYIIKNKKKTQNYAWLSSKKMLDMLDYEEPNVQEEYILIKDENGTTQINGEWYRVEKK